MNQTLQPIVRLVQHLTFAGMALFGFVLGAQAQDVTEADIKHDVMVVFDASGSMWGQVDGVAKITIARQAFDGLLADWDANKTRAGLIAYGHRQRGDCSDIELLAQPAEKGDLSALVAELTPRGKTPLSDAVRRAAEVLKFTEEAATVVLISDGIETCEADPCAVGAHLESLGLDFTAHVIGFDIAKADKAQLQCLATATGGQYFDASDADDLADAMAGVAAATVASGEPEPKPALKLKSVIVRLGLPRFQRFPAEIIIYNGDVELGRLTDDTAVVPGLSIDLPLGLTNFRVEGRAISGSFEVDITDETEIITLELAPDPDTFVMLLEGPLPVAGTHLVLIKNETGIDQDIGPLVYLMPAGSTNPDDRVGKARGQYMAGVFWPIEITSPTQAGAYDVVVFDGRDREELGRVPITFADDVKPEWLGARMIEPGGLLDAKWRGDANARSTFQLVNQDGDAKSSVRISNLATKDGYKLQAPKAPGLYNLQFTFNDRDGVKTEVSFGQITIGATLPDEVVETTLDAAADSPDAIALDGEWQLITTKGGQTIHLLTADVEQQAGADIGGGGLVVTAHPGWGFGPTNSFGEMVLSPLDAGSMLMTLTFETGTLVTDLSSNELGWSGALDMGDGAIRDVTLARPHDIMAAQINDFPNGIDHQLTAVDERGAKIAGTVEWTLQSPNMSIADTLISQGPAYETGRAPGTYQITAIAGDMSGELTVSLGRQERRANFVVLKPHLEGADLAIDTGYFCSRSEDCRMTEPQLQFDFTLPDGWGSERPAWLRDSGPMLRMSANTLNGPVFASLNRPYGIADGGTCVDLISGQFCHSATNDPALLADIDTIKRALSFLNAGRALSGDDYDAMILKLTGAAQ